VTLQTGRTEPFAGLAFWGPPCLLLLVLPRARCRPGHLFALRRRLPITSLCCSFVPHHMLHPHADRVEESRYRVTCGEVLPRARQKRSAHCKP
jgi:hypothetical protein